MPLLIALALQAGPALDPPVLPQAPASTPSQQDARPIEFDLSVLARAEPPISTSTNIGCTPGADGDIVVCGIRDRDTRWRLGALPPAPLGDSKDLAIHLPGGGVLGMEAQTVQLGGVASQRMMLTFKIPF